MARPSASAVPRRRPPPAHPWARHRPIGAPHALSSTTKTVTTEPTPAPPPGPPTAPANPPRPPPGPALDVAPAFLADPLGTLELLAAQHGPLVGMSLAGRPVVVVSDPGAARDVLVDRPDVFVKARRLSGFVVVQVW